MIDHILEMRLACDIDNMCHWHPLQWSRLWIVHPPPSPGSSRPSLFCLFSEVDRLLFCTDQILQSATSHILPHLLPPILSFNRFNPGSTLPQPTSESDVSVSAELSSEQCKAEYQQSWAVYQVDINLFTPKALSLSAQIKQAPLSHFYCQLFASLQKSDPLLMDQFAFSRQYCQINRFTLTGQFHILIPDPLSSGSISYTNPSTALQCTVISRQ